MKRNKCDECKELSTLRQRIYELSRQLDVAKQSNAQLKSEVNYYHLNSIPISLDEKFVLYEWHNQRVQAQQAEDETQHNAKLNKLLDSLAH